jgi:hypothetical protein
MSLKTERVVGSADKKGKESGTNHRVQAVQKGARGPAVRKATWVS